MPSNAPPGSSGDAGVLEFWGHYTNSGVLGSSGDTILISSRGVLGTLY
jgi:hypothetical protein